MTDEISGLDNVASQNNKINQGSASTYSAPSDSIQKPPTRSHLLMYIGSIIFAAIAITAVYMALPFMHNPFPVATSTTTITSQANLSVSIPEVANSLIINKTDVLFGVTNVSSYVLVENNTVNAYMDAAAVPYWLVSTNYALNYSLPIVAPKEIISPNIPMDIPAYDTDFTEPISSGLSVYIYSNSTNAANAYTALMTPYINAPSSFTSGNVTVETAFLQQTFQRQPSFVFTEGPVYGDAMVATRVVQYKNFIIEINSMGTYNAFSLDYTDLAVGHMMSVLGS